MIGNVFVSFATEDRVQAYALVDHLESRGVTCWIAPRNIPEGTPYATAIIDGIRASDAILVLLSPASAASPHVLRELDSAVAAARPILTVQLDGTRPSDALAYYLATTQWISAGAGDWTRDGDRVLSALGRATDAPAFRPRVSAAMRATWSNPDARSLVVVACGLTAVSTLMMLVSRDYRVDEYASFVQHGSLIVLVMAAWFAIGLLSVPLLESIRARGPRFGQRTSSLYAVPVVMLLLAAGVWTAFTDDSLAWFFRWAGGPFAVASFSHADAEVVGWLAAHLIVGWYFGALLLLFYRVPTRRTTYRHAVAAAASASPFLVVYHSSQTGRWLTAAGVCAVVLVTAVTRARVKLGIAFADSASRGLIAGGSVMLFAISAVMSVAGDGRTTVYLQNRLVILVLIGLVFALARGLERAAISLTPRSFRWKATAGVFIASGCLAFAVRGLWQTVEGYWFGWIGFVSLQFYSPFWPSQLSSLDIFGLSQLYLHQGQVAVDLATLLVIGLYLGAWVFFVHGLLPERSLFRRVTIVLGSLTPFLIPGVFPEERVKLGVYAAAGGTAIAVGLLMIARPTLQIAVRLRTATPEASDQSPKSFVSTREQAHEIVPPM